MNFKLLVQLSAFGLIMAFGTISLIPEKLEPIFWIAIFIFCAIVIAKAAPGKYFLHGFALSLINCIWITAAHTYFFDTYRAHHPSQNNFDMGTHPRLMTACFGVIIGAVWAWCRGFLPTSPQNW